MNHLLIDNLFQRINTDKSESDFAYFWSLLLASESIAKIIVLAMLAALDDDTENHRYRLEYKIVRANGLGDWTETLQDALSGPASQFLDSDALTERNQLTNRYSTDDWQFVAVSELKSAIEILDLDLTNDLATTRATLLTWFRLFTYLRNKTRGHGATLVSKSGRAAPHLIKSLEAICDNFTLFQREWVYLHRNLSGKYRVSTIGNPCGNFDYLKSEPDHSLSNGIYVHFGSHRLVRLFQSDPDLSDFFLPNGAFTNTKYDLLSYTTDDKLNGDASEYLRHPDLPQSETQGRGELVVRGNTLSNAPDPSKDYVSRLDLEAELYQRLTDDRHPVITLQGTGGVGKTSSALKVIDKLADEGQFEEIIWFSARDIDLLPTGPKTVRRDIFTPKDVADQFASLVLSEKDLADKRFDRETHFQQALSQPSQGGCLFVFDNFETVQNPLEMFIWIDNAIRLPNKILITTRLRNFKADFPIEVLGMTNDEAEKLISHTASRLNIVDLLRPTRVNELISASGGHPYVIKILLGEIADTKQFRSPRQVIAGSSEILTALFERTYNALTPCGQRAFMTVAAWNSAVPRVALEAILMGSTFERREVERGIDSLIQFSLAEEHSSNQDGQIFISLPLAAHSFGKGKLQISMLKSAIESDVQILHMFGPTSTSGTNVNLGRHLNNFIRNVAAQIDRGESFSKYEPILDMVCRSYNPGWLQLAEWRIERGTDSDLEAAIQNIESFLQVEPNGPASPNAWRRLANVYSLQGNTLGEIHAYVERAQFKEVPFYDLSNTANLLNRKYNELNLEEGKLQITQRLLNVMEARCKEANADDCSKMAWLALHLGMQNKAEEFTSKGLEIDPTNLHCLNIVDRLGL